MNQAVATPCRSQTNLSQAPAWSIPLTVLLVTPALLAAAVPMIADTFQYHRDVVASEWTRLVTCHWAHWSAEHAFWDILMFVVLAAVCENRSRLALFAATVTSAIAISATLWFWTPGLAAYRGLSGIDSCLFALAATGIFAEAWKKRAWWYLAGGVAFALGFVAKTLFEIVTGGTLFVDSSASAFVPVPVSHLVGAAVGLAVGVVSELRRTSTTAALGENR